METLRKKDSASKPDFSGFTLIELLIVIVIVGVLAGLVIAILNPAKQRARAKDSVTVSALNKIATELKVFATSDLQGRYLFPRCAVLISTLSNATACGGGSSYSGPVDAPTSGYGNFQINGVTDESNNNLVIYYKFDNTASTFCLAARSVVAETSKECIMITQNTNPGYVGYASDCGAQAVPNNSACD